MTNLLFFQNYLVFSLRKWVVGTIENPEETGPFFQRIQGWDPTHSGLLNWFGHVLVWALNPIYTTTISIIAMSAITMATPIISYPTYPCYPSYPFDPLSSLVSFSDGSIADIPRIHPCIGVPWRRLLEYCGDFH